MSDTDRAIALRGAAYHLTSAASVLAAIAGDDPEISRYRDELVARSEDYHKRADAEPPAPAPDLAGQVDRINALLEKGPAG